MKRTVLDSRAEKDAPTQPRGTAYLLALFPPRLGRRRSGVSLMEVLIGTFVLSIGMLGLAALIPIGRFAIVETGKSDRSSACGRAGLREVKVQRMLDPETWYGTDLTQVNNPMPAFAIDPMQIARARVATNVNRFPYNPPVGALSMRRITLKSMLANGNALSLPLARRTFVWRDELLFDRPDDATARPRRQVRNGTVGEVGPYPPMFNGEVNFNATPLVPQVDENYSWMVTVTPAYVENRLEPADKRLYSISVVVFWKRDYTVDSAPKPSERIVTAKMFGGGYGGGDVRLSGRAPLLEVKENQWLMLCGEVQTRSGRPKNYVFQWYRVLSAAEIDGAERFVTLAGPDWKNEWCLDRNNQQTQAVLLDGVIGVYATTVELDRDLMWHEE